MTINQVVDMVAAWAEEKGWNEPITPEMIGTKMFLITSELVEAFEFIRENDGPNTVFFQNDANGISKPEGFGVEIADAVIRILHLVALTGVDLEKMLELKMAYNRLRPHRHGKSC